MGKRPSQMVSNACDYRFLMPVRIAAANTGAYSVPQNGRRRNTQLRRRERKRCAPPGMEDAPEAHSRRRPAI